MFCLLFLFPVPVVYTTVSHADCDSLLFSLLKDSSLRPRYSDLLEHSFIQKYDEADVDVAGWYKDIVTHSSTHES